MVDKFTKPKSGKAITDKINEIIDNLGSGGGTVDDALSTTSTNPVQNKVITQALEDNKDVFVAEYGTTTFAEVTSALNEGKVVLCKHTDSVLGSVLVPYTGTNANSHLFIYTRISDYNVIRLNRANNSWIESTTTIVTKVNNTSPDSNGDVAITIPTYNFNGDPFYSTDGDTTGISRDCNSLTANGHYYYNSNGPSGLGEQSTDGAVFVQAYSNNWVVQIAQDYRTGNLFTRSKNNGTWTAWKTVGDINSSSLTQVQVVVETYSSGSSWYRVWSDGWCEQGDTIVGTTTNHSTVSLLKPYRDISYSVVFGNLYKAATVTATSIVANTTKTPSSFQVYDSTDANFSTYWISYGYLY